MALSDDRAVRDDDTILVDIIGSTSNPYNLFYTWYFSALTIWQYLCLVVDSTMSPKTGLTVKLHQTQIEPYPNKRPHWSRSWKLPAEIN